MAYYRLPRLMIMSGRQIIIKNMGIPQNIMKCGQNNSKESFMTEKMHG